MADNIEGQVADADQLRKILTTHTSETAALSAGLKLAMRTPIGLVVAVIYGLIGGYVGFYALQLAIGLKEMDPATRTLWGQIALGVAVFTAIYAAVQFSKADRASRASWWPTIFAVPALLVWGCTQIAAGSQARQLAPMILLFSLSAWALVWTSFGGAAAAIFWIRSAHGALEGRPASVGSMVDEVRSRLLDVTGPHAARQLAVTVGMQFLLPGIFYALQLAFTNMISVLDPERPVLRRAGQLSTGMRGRLFRMMAAWYAIGSLLTLAISMPLEGVNSVDTFLEVLQELFLDPSSTTLATMVVTEILWALFSWWLTLSLLVLYLERESQVRAKVALKKLQKETAPSPSAEPAPQG